MDPPSGLPSLFIAPLGFGLRLVASGPICDPDATMVAEHGRTVTERYGKLNGKKKSGNILIHTVFRSLGGILELLYHILKQTHFKVVKLALP